MAMKQTGRKVHRSMLGKEIDLEKLRQKNEMTPAVGNARVNARGDELGPGGKIIKKREDIIKEYYDKHPSAVPDEVIPRRVKAQPAETNTGWVEDEEGNFVKKGE